MSRIFISYKREDKDKVFPIVEEIEKKTGVACWIDHKGIESGSQFQNVIIEAIEDAVIFVFMLSEKFIAPYRDEKTGKIDVKRQTFPQKEVMYAINEGKRIVPISIDGTTVNDCKWLKFNCSGIDYIDYNESTQKDKLFENIKEWCKNEKPKLLSIIVHDKYIKQTLDVINGAAATIMNIEHSTNYITLTVNIHNDVAEKIVSELNKISDDITIMKVATWIDVLLPVCCLLSPVTMAIANVLSIYGKNFLKRFVDPIDESTGNASISERVDSDKPIQS